MAIPNQPTRRALAPPPGDNSRIGRDPPSAKGASNATDPTSNKRLVRRADDQWLLNRIFRGGIPNGDAQLVASLRVAQDGRLFGGHAMRFADGVGMRALQCQESEEGRSEQMFQVNLPKLAVVHEQKACYPWQKQ